MSYEVVLFDAAVQVVRELSDSEINDVARSLGEELTGSASDKTVLLDLGASAYLSQGNREYFGSALSSGYLAVTAGSTPTRSPRKSGFAVDPSRPQPFMASLI